MVRPRNGPSSRSRVKAMGETPSGWTTTVGAFAGLKRLATVSSIVIVCMCFSRSPAG
jgi:hypothetical protein